MPFRPPNLGPKFADLKGILAQSNQTDESLYQTIEILLERLDLIFPTIEAGGAPHALTHELNGADPITNLDGSVITTGTIDTARLDTDVATGYFEGNWQPNDASGGGLIFPALNPAYTKIGQVVLFGCDFTYPVTANGAAAKIGNLPHTVGGKAGNAAVGFCNAVVAVTAYVRAATKQIELYAVGGGAITNAQMSGKTISLGGFYFI